MQDIQLVTEKTILPFITPKFDELVKLIGRDNLTRETSFALQAVNANDYLSKASPQSVAKSIWNIAITGLTLNPIHKLAYLTPRNVKGQVEAILTPSYQGMIKLLTDTGSVKTVYAHCVYDGDEFEVILGDEYTIRHKPKFKSKNISHVYAIGILNDGTKQLEVMPIDEINRIRDMSEGYRAFREGKTKTAIWETHFGEMARKTVLKRLSKYLPKTQRWDNLNEAISLDNSDYSASHNQISYIDRLLANSTLDEMQRSHIENQLSCGVSIGEAEDLINNLQCNQLDPITQGSAYSATDIKEKQGRIE
jgi:recombination protein RecT